MKFSDNISYNPLTLSSTNPALSLALALDNPLNDVSCLHSGSQVDPPPTGVRGIFSPVGSLGLDSVPSCSPNGSISTSAIFHSVFLK